MIKLDILKSQWIAIFNTYVNLCYYKTKGTYPSCDT